jgi:hypothetical protein
MTAHLGTELEDVAHELMTDDTSLAHAGGLARQQMQIGGAYGGLLHRDEGIAALDDRGVRDLVDPYAAAGEDDGFQRSALAVALLLNRCGMGTVLIVVVPPE